MLRAGLLTLCAVAVAAAQGNLQKGQELMEAGRYGEARWEYQQALDADPDNSLAHYRMGEAWVASNDLQQAANEFRECINGDQTPSWTLVWSHINLGKIFAATGQRFRAIDEYELALRTRDDTQGARNVTGRLLDELKASLRR